MVFVGLAITVCGFLIALSSVAVTASTGGRLVMVLIGIAISLAGIFGVMNTAYLKEAIWKK